MQSSLVLVQSNFATYIIQLKSQQFSLSNFNYRRVLKKVSHAGKIAEKVVQRSAFLILWHCILNADITKSHSFRRTFVHFSRLALLSLRTIFPKNYKRQDCTLAYVLFVHSLIRTQTPMFYFRCWCSKRTSFLRGELQ